MLYAIRSCGLPVCFVAAVLFAACVSAGEVVTLTTENFEELTSTGSWIIDFYAPWCSHCKKLEPIFEEVAEDAPDSISLGKVDCTTEKAIQRAYDVKSFPTLLFRRDGETRPYRHDRTHKGFQEFIATVTADPVVAIKRKQLPKHLEEHAVSFLFLGATDAPEYSVFESQARLLQGVCSFIQSNNKKLIKSMKVTSTPAVVVLTDGGDQESFTGPWNAETLRAFLEKHKMPLVSTLSASNFADVVESSQLSVFCVTNPDSKLTPRYLTAARHVAKQFREKFIFVNLDGIKFDKYVAQFGLSPEHYPVMFVFDYENEQYFQPSPEYPVDKISNMIKYLDAVYEGKIPAKTLGAWWSPVRLVKWFEKWLGQFSEIELAIGSVLIFTSMTGCCFWLFCTGPTDEYDEHIERHHRERGDKKKERERVKTAGIVPVEDDEDWHDKKE